MAGREQHRAALHERKLGQLAPAPLVVLAITHDELDQVLGLEARELVIAIARLFARGGSLHVDHADDTRVYSRERHRTARLEREAQPGITQASQQFQTVRLRK